MAARLGTALAWLWCAGSVGLAYMVEGVLMRPEIAASSQWRQASVWFTRSYVTFQDVALTGTLYVAGITVARYGLARMGRPVAPRYRILPLVACVLLSEVVAEVPFKFGLYGLAGPPPVPTDGWYDWWPDAIPAGLTAAGAVARHLAIVLAGLLPTAVCAWLASRRRRGR
jgi:hypothetical protein